MTPVDQTITGNGGDCFRAAIASILDLPTEEVPHFFLEADMNAAASKWLAARGIALLPMCFVDPEALQRTHFAFRGHCVLGGYGPRKNERGDHRRHGVVAKLQVYGVEVVHDPHPEKSGLLNWGHRWVWLLVSPGGVL